MTTRWLEYHCAACAEEFYVPYKDGIPEHDTACVNCGAEDTFTKEQWRTDNGQFGVGA